MRTSQVLLMTQVVFLIITSMETIAFVKEKISYKSNPKSKILTLAKTKSEMETFNLNILKKLIKLKNKIIYRMNKKGETHKSRHSFCDLPMLRTLYPIRKAVTGKKVSCFL